MSRKTDIIRHHLLTAISNVRKQMGSACDYHHAQGSALDALCGSLVVKDEGADGCRVMWEGPVSGGFVFVPESELYLRGDKAEYVEKQKARGLLFGNDTVMDRNKEYFEQKARRILSEAGLIMAEARQVVNKFGTQESFHDDWAGSIDVEKIDPVMVNESVTSPELRYIRAQLGDIKGKRILDIGCGLGEVSVYFAMQGADVTAMDTSSGMLDVAKKLAARHHVEISTMQSSIEQLSPAETGKFDIVYAGNLLHHVNISQSMGCIAGMLKDTGIFVSWDPLAYNPLINVYRAIATGVRVEDEHPLTRTDIKTIGSFFTECRTKCFWLMTLAVFVAYFLSGKNPNKVRYWKKIIDDGARLAWLYKPLEFIDKILLTVLPMLKWLCWNVVIIARGPGKGK